LALVKEIWLVSRELGGWAEAGGIKDVVKDQADSFPKIGWTTHVVLPLYGFLQSRVTMEGDLVWSGKSSHPTREVGLEAWVIQDGNHTLHFLDSPSFQDKDSLYTYTAEDESRNPQKVRGEGYADSFVMNLEFQWAVATYWTKTDTRPSLVLGHDGHVGFLAAVARLHPDFDSLFQTTTFGLLIHNAGSGYRQEMPADPFHESLIGLPSSVTKAFLLDHHYDPIVAAGRCGRLATVSENYADELLTGRNDHWSGPFGRWLRSSEIALAGITNGITTDDKDPRRPEAAGLPVGFDPLEGKWEGKSLCRRFLREHLLMKPLSVYGRVTQWDQALYVMQGRLTAQKGVDALVELLVRALKEQPQATFLIMAQGEKHYEERLIHVARETTETGRFLFINKFEESLAQLVFASGDFFLMPSEYEPCGLTDLKAQLMGTLPIVHRVGGLVKVLDEKTGFSYVKNKEGGLWGTFLRSLHLWKVHPEELLKMRHRAFVRVIEDFQWVKILEDSYIPWLTEPPKVPYPH
jgi:starch synthase